MPDQQTTKTPAKQFLDVLKSVVRCVTKRHLSVSVDAAETFRRLAFFSEPVVLRAPDGGPSGLLLDVFHQFAIVPPESDDTQPRWRVTTGMYEYRLLDHHQTELLVYHWQPGAKYAGPDHPHLHVSAALHARTGAIAQRDIDLDKLHIATGQVTLEAFVRMLISEFGVAPQRHDWRPTLDRTGAVLRDGTIHWP